MDPDQVRTAARQASTEYLLDRVTVYRAEMEPGALELFEAELTARGVGGVAINRHAAWRDTEAVARHPDGTAARCTFCPRPAVERRWQWYRLWGWFLPLFPRPVYLCEEHLEGPTLDPYGRPLHFDRDRREPDDGPA